MNTKIICHSSQPTVSFAAQELKKYLRMMMPLHGDIPISGDIPQGGFHLGTFDDFGIQQEGIDKAVDDVVLIQVKDKNGIIAGSNPRSVLLAVYRYLHLCGCRWPRPGLDGEMIPLADCADVDYRHKASRRHRGFCEEGALSRRNLFEVIDWAPKIGYNAFFFQGLTPFVNYNRWYAHQKNPLKEPEAVSIDNIRQYTAALEAEIVKRGLLYHAAGHDWTCAPFGIKRGIRTPSDPEIADDVREMLALVDGKRDLHKNIGLYTNLCYSNPRARDILVRACADYAEKNGHVDYLHMWLADGYNNHCECEECQKHLPSDLYIMLLNQIDAEFERRALPTKVVFLLYYDLFWPPRTNTLNNPERFTLMFAPIARSYSEPYAAPPEIQLPEYRRNKLAPPAGMDEVTSFLSLWQKGFGEDGFAFEYYFWMDHFNDPGYYEIAKTICQDIKGMPDIGLNGLLSCQSMRSCFPTGFPQYLMGQTLFDTNSDFDDLAADFFSRCYGRDGEKCRAYMAELSELFDPDYLRKCSGQSGREHYANARAVEKLKRVAPLVQGFRKVIEENLHSGIRCMDTSWRMLLPHAELCVKLAAAYLARAEGNFNEAIEKKDHAISFARLHEDELQDVLDVYVFTLMLESRFLHK